MSFTHCFLYPLTSTLFLHLTSPCPATLILHLLTSVSFALFVLTHRHDTLSRLHTDTYVHGDSSNKMPRGYMNRWRHRCENGIQSFCVSTITRVQTLESEEARVDLLLTRRSFRTWRPIAPRIIIIVRGRGCRNGRTRCGNRARIPTRVQSTRGSVQLRR